MTITSKKFLSRIKELSEHHKKVGNYGTLDDAELDYITFGTLSLLKILYGDKHEFISQLTQDRKLFMSRGRNELLGYGLKGTINAILNSIEFEIKNGLISSLEIKNKGEIIGDFLSLAKSLINDGYKDSAAVLAAGALEDVMKKFALTHKLTVDDKDLSTVVNALKSKGLIKGIQSGLIQSYITLRNKAFHAQFDKIEKSDILNLINFVENFLVEHFGLEK